MDLDSKNNEFKIVIMGDSSVGKTSIVQRFHQETFDFQMDTTIGATFLTKVVQTSQGQVTLNVWDTAGQERYRSLIPTYARGANAAIICFDLTSMVSFQSLDKWIEELHKFCSQDTPLYIIGNKCDLVPLVSKDEANMYAQNHSSTYMSTSALDGTGVSDLFQSIAEKLSHSQDDPNLPSLDLDSKPQTKKGCC